MDKCKFCQQELAEDSTVCPHCGKDNALDDRQAAAPQETTEEVKEENVTAQAEPAEEEKPRMEAAQKAEDEKPAEEKPQAERPQEPKKAAPGKIALAVGAVVVLSAVLIALIISALGGKQDKTPVETLPEELKSSGTVAAEATVPATVPADGDPENETCKGSYTVSEADVLAAGDKVVAQAGEYTLTNAQLQMYYWRGIQSFLQGNPYAVYMGLDLSKPLDTQPCMISEGRTWQQFFLHNAITSWLNYQSMAAEAEANGHVIGEDLKEFLDTIPDQLEKQAQEGGFQDSQEMLNFNMGPGVFVDDFVDFMKLYNVGYDYFLASMEKQAPSDENLETYFSEHKTELEEGGITKESKVVDVRHILVAAEDPASEASWKEAEEKARKLLDEFLAGDKTEDSFATMASERTEDPGSKQTGGLYQNVVRGQMVPEFDQWCFDASRKTGDTGIVKTDYGYHVMYFVSDRLIWKDQVTQILVNEMAEKFINEAAAKYPLEVDYGAVVLGELKVEG